MHVSKKFIFFSWILYSLVAQREVLLPFVLTLSKTFHFGNLYKLLSTRAWCPKFVTDNGRFPTIPSLFLPTTCISFTKLKFRQSFWGAEQVYNFIGLKVMTQNVSIFVSLFCFGFLKNLLICVKFFAFFVFFAFFFFWFLL